jgi:hypothetical protein
MVFSALLGGIFEQWTILCSRAHIVAVWQPSHTNIPLFWLLFQDSVVASPCYIALAQTPQ